jgi:photosystem II stability/assembly factor-like uncharacterized protein
MPDTARVYVGTIGQSIWRSWDGGLTFARASSGLPSESDIRAVSIDPSDTRSILLGAETGLYASADGADRWQRVPSPLDGRQVWCLTRDPHHPRRVYAGSCPAGVFVSDDGGHSWRELPARLPTECLGGAPLTPRVTCIYVDAVDGTLFVGVEIGGVHRSRDAGETWTAHTHGLSSPDIHGLVAVWEGGRRRLLATTNNDVNRSEDDGDSWTSLGVGATFPWTYTRACQADPLDPGIIWVGAGNGPPGSEGGLYRSQDAGDSWERMALPGLANSTIWSLAFNPADSLRMYAASISGQLFLTRDGGATWVKLPREFGEVRALAWHP